MNELYIPNYDTSYHYARFNSYYIDFYNVDTLRPNQTYDFYRYYLYDGVDMLEHLSTTTSSYSNLQQLTNVDIYTNEKEYLHRDYYKATTIFLTIFIVFMFLLKLFSRPIFKNGGIF